jgi:formylmethanofuran dehydrogenase subunit B
MFIMSGELKITRNTGDYNSVSSSASAMIRLEEGDDIHVVAAELQAHLKERVLSQLSEIPGTKISPKERDLGVDPVVIQAGDIVIQLDEVTGRYQISLGEQNANLDNESDS